MMTRTSAQDYRGSQIFMTAVDTGWINDEKPLERAAAHEKRHAFQTPLDEVDAAARILDPILAPCSARDFCNGDQAKIDALPEPQCELTLVYERQAHLLTPFLTHCARTLHSTSCGLCTCVLLMRMLARVWMAFRWCFFEGLHEDRVVMPVMRRLLRN